MTRPDDIARRVQDFDRMPQHLATRIAEREEYEERRAGFVLVVLVSIAAAIGVICWFLLLVNVLPNVAATLADPLANSPY